MDKRCEATTSKGMGIMFALATQPGLVAKSYRAIADASGVALGTVNLAIADLIARKERRRLRRHGRDTRVEFDQRIHRFRKTALNLRFARPARPPQTDRHPWDWPTPSAMSLHRTRQT
jgi:hypothetical protein